MTEDQKITPKLSERFSDLFGVDELSNELSIEEDSFPIYGEESRKLSLNKLLHLAPYSEVLLLLGEQGVGKTTLLKAFVERVATTWRISFISAGTLMDGDDFLRQIAKGFGLELDVIGATEDLLWEVNRYLQAVGRGGRRAIIIVDDAHLLTDDVILIAERILHDERTDDSVSLLLSMRLDQGDKLDRFALLKERLAYTLTLEPFSKKEVAGYLRQRLAGKTAQFESLFTPETIATLHQKSRGIPEEINALAHGMLVEKKRVANPKAKKKPLLAGAFVVVVGVAAAAALYYQDEINQLLEVPERQQMADGEATGPADIIASESIGSQDVVVVHLQNDESLPISIPEIEQDLSAAPQQAPPAEAVELGVLPESQTSGPVAIKEQVEQAKQEQLAQAEPATIASNKTVSEAEKRMPEPKAEPEPAPAEPELSPQLKWLMAQPGSSYTLQLMALVEENKVLGYVDRLNIADQSATFPITRRGKVLIVLVYGSFPNRAEATKAAADIPRSWGVGQPWIRSFASVRKDHARK